MSAAHELEATSQCGSFTQGRDQDSCPDTHGKETLISLCLLELEANKSLLCLGDMLRKKSGSLIVRTTCCSFRGWDCRHRGMTSGVRTGDFREGRRHSKLRLTADCLLLLLLELYNTLGLHSTGLVLIAYTGNVWTADGSSV